MTNSKRWGGFGPALGQMLIEYRKKRDRNPNIPLTDAELSELRDRGLIEKIKRGRITRAGENLISECRYAEREDIVRELASVGMTPDGRYFPGQR